MRYEAEGASRLEHGGSRGPARSGIVPRTTRKSAFSSNSPSVPLHSHLDLALDHGHRILRERPGWRSADHLSFEVESASVAGAEDISLLLPPVNEAAQVGADGRE